MNAYSYLLSLFVLVSIFTDTSVAENSRPLKVNTVVITSPVSHANLSLNAVVVPADLTQLSFRIPGKISQIHVREGDNVEQGQILAQLENRQLQQKLKDQSARFELIQKQFERGKSLFTQDLLSKSEYDELNANFRLAEANFKSAQLQLGYSKITAPFSGRIANIDKKSFESITPGSPLLSLYRTDRIDILINIADHLITQIGRVKTGKPIEAIISFANREGTYQASFLEKTLQPVPKTKTFQTWFTLPQLEQPIYPGRPVIISANSHSAGFESLEGHILPLSALVAGHASKDFAVWKAEEGVAKKVEVITGEINDQGVRVLHGVNQGDLIITSRQEKLRPGMAIITE